MTKMCVEKANLTDEIFFLQSSDDTEMTSTASLGDVIGVGRLRHRDVSMQVRLWKIEIYTT